MTTELEFHECPRCGYNTPYKYNLKPHLTTKKLCAPLNSDMDREQILVQLFPNFHEKESNSFECKTCHKMFKNANSLGHHQRKSCKGVECDKDKMERLVKELAIVKKAVIGIRKEELAKVKEELRSFNKKELAKAKEELKCNKVDNVGDKNEDPAQKRKGWIYLVQEREFVRSSETIYKVGQTVEIGKRLVKYPSGSIPYLVLHTSGNDHVELEKNILQQFRKMFVSRTDIGLEYFEGDVGQMIEIIMDLQREGA